MGYNPRYYINLSFFCIFVSLVGVRAGRAFGGRKRRSRGQLPRATEVCAGDDNNCDGVVDEANAIGEGTWYADADGDGFGDPGVAVESCAVPSGYLADDSDCDDTDPAINELALEVCDGVDNNCDAQVDEAGAADAPLWYADTDGDGYGSDATAVTVCETPAGHVAEGGDCNEGDADVFPGAPETDYEDPVDYNCDGSSAYADDDADGAPACEDCNDADAQIGPEGTETCNDVDDDCDGRVDADAVDASEWYPDGDGDGYTLGDGAVRESDPPPGRQGSGGRHPGPRRHRRRGGHGLRPLPPRGGAGLADGARGGPGAASGALNPSDPADRPLRPSRGPSCRGRRAEAAGGARWPGGQRRCSWRRRPRGWSSHADRR